MGLGKFIESILSCCIATILAQFIIEIINYWFDKKIYNLQI